MLVRHGGWDRAGVATVAVRYLGWNLAEVAREIRGVRCMALAQGTKRFWTAAEKDWDRGRFAARFRSEMSKVNV